MNLTAASPVLLLIAIPALALLLLFRLFRAKRRRVRAGSLLIWKRLATLPVSAKPKRVILDASLYLQAAAMLALSAALAGIHFVPAHSNDRTIILVMDNGVLSRARDSQGIPKFAAVASATKTMLDGLRSSDRIYVARSSPTPMVLNASPVNLSEARSLVDQIIPALSGPDVSAIRLFASDRARSLQTNASAQTAIISLRADAQEFQQTHSSVNGVRWIQTNMPQGSLDNVAIVDAGSAKISPETGGKSEILVRIANFSDHRVDGRVLAEGVSGSSKLPSLIYDQPLTIDARSDKGVYFPIAVGNPETLRISWNSKDGMPDALPEDDLITMVPRAEHAPRVRFHAPQPALEKLMRLATDAVIVAPDATNAREDIDLDIFTGSVPERLPDDTHAAMFLAPERGYQSFFDVSETVIKWPAVQRGDASSLTSGIGAGGQSGIAIPKAFTLLHTGDFTALLREAETGRILAARFIDEKSRPCYVLAFTPGEGLPTERALDPALAAILVRMVLEAARTGPPFSIQKVAGLEVAKNAPLALDWRPNFSTEAHDGMGVLEEMSSNLNALTSGVAQPPPVNLNRLFTSSGTSAASAWDLTPWLLIAALLFAAAELFITEST